MCCSCCKRLYMAILAIVSIGIVLAALIIALIYIETKANFDQTVEIVSIAIVVISGVILLFAIYASCCGKYCALTTLGVIYTIFLLALIAGAACIWIFENKINEEVTEVFQNFVFNRTDEQKDFVEAFEKTFECCGYKLYDPSLFRWCSKNDWPKCDEKIEPAVNTLVNIIGVLCCVAAFFMLIGIFTACLMAKKKKEKSSSSRAGGIRYKA